MTAKPKMKRITDADINAKIKKTGYARYLTFVFRAIAELFKRVKWNRERARDLSLLQSKYEVRLQWFEDRVSALENGITSPSRIHPYSEAEPVATVFSRGRGSESMRNEDYADSIKHSNEAYGFFHPSGDPLEHLFDSYDGIQEEDENTDA